MYTDAYKSHQKAFNGAQIAFDKSPSKKTATILSNLRETKFSDVDKFTPEHLEKRDLEIRADNLKRGKMMSNLVNTIAIERQFENKQIDEKTYVELHKLNDQINPLK